MTAYLDDSTPSRPSIGKWIRNGVVTVVLLLLAFLLVFPRFTRSHPGRSDQSEAISNLRQLGLALHEFEEAYGKMPDAATAAAVRKSTGTALSLGTKTSNDFFRQLIATDICESEFLFRARISGTHRPDNQTTGTKALEKGECGFTYFSGAAKGCNPARPLAAAPMIPGTDRFDPEPFNLKAVVLRADNSVMSLKIDKQGHAVFEEKNLMDPAHPVWQGKAPSIAWPDL